MTRHLAAACGPFALLLASLVGLACQPQARHDTEPGGEEALGGAFAIYPEPAHPEAADSSAGDADNPWLDFGKERASEEAGPSSSEPPDIASEDPSLAGPETRETNSTGGTTSSPTSLEKPAEPTVPPAAEMIFVGYWESTGAAKLLVVDHLAGGPSLDCAVEIYSNGGTDPWRSLPIPDGTAAGTRQVLCIPDAHHPECTTAFGGSAFNGNDALRLRCGSVTQDVLGVIGVDPGDSWRETTADGQDLGTADSGLWRCQSAAAPEFSLTDWLPWDPELDSELEGADCKPRSPDEGWGGAGGAIPGD